MVLKCSALPELIPSFRRTRLSAGLLTLGRGDDRRRDDDYTARLNGGNGERVGS